MHIAFLLDDLGAAGDAGAVIAHAAHLRRHHGIDAEVVLTEPQGHPAAPHAGLSDVPVRAWEDASGAAWDVAVASTWSTALVGFRLPAAAHALHLRGHEQTGYDADDRARLGAAMATSLPLHLLATEAWLAGAVQGGPDGPPVAVVPDGVDLAAFPPLERQRPASPEGPLRVLVAGARDDARNGVADALMALQRTEASVFVTWLAPRPAERPHRVHRVLTAADGAQRAALLADHHVLLTLERRERHAAAVHEAFRCAATVVASATSGHAEAIVHGETGLLVDVHDLPGTVRALELLASDRALLERLRDGARQAGRWRPGWEDASGALAGELRRIAATPEPAARAAGGLRMARDMVAALADLQRAGRAAETEAAVTAALQEERAYRVAQAMQGAAQRGRAARGRLAGAADRLRRR